MQMIEQRLLPVGREHNRPGVYLNAIGLGIHRTGNDKPGADANAHAKYFETYRGASYHFVIDDKDIIQLIPTNEWAWHGGGWANARYISAGICEHEGIDFGAAYANLVWLCAYLLDEQGWGDVEKRTHGHFEWNPTDRPSDPIGLFDWSEFLADIERELGTVDLGTPILGEPVATLAQAREFVKLRNLAYAPIAALYYDVAHKYGVRPDGALAQACKETGFFQYGGDVLPSQNNFAGLGATGGGVKGASFASWEQGVHAHVQHLYCYASTEPLPAGVDLVDPRWDAAVSAYGRGSARTWEALGGKWAPSPEYGKSILRDYLADMVAIEVETEQTVPLAEYEAAMDRVNELEHKLSRIAEILEEE